MTEHDTAMAERQRRAPTYRSAALQRRAQAPAADGSAGITCRLGDASCASAHAATVARSAAGRGTALQRSLLGLQRRYGNAYVGQVLRQTATDEPDDDAASAAHVERSIDRARAGGHGIDAGTRTRMETAFGADFSGVRIHADGESDRLSRALDARAFTTGRDVFFRSGEYSPGTSAGRELLAHELTHVVQQNGDEVRRKMTVSEPGDPQEVEADEMARAVVAGE